MPDPALAALAQALRTQALATNQRRALVLSGTATWTLDQARLVASAGPPEPGRTLWLSNRDLPEPRLPITAGERLLGTELDTLVYDAHSGLDLDGLGAALGALRGGGLLILLTPDLDAWPLLPDPLVQALPGLPEADPCRPTPAAKPSLTIGRLIRVLRQAPGVTLLRPGQPLPQPPVSPAHPRAPVHELGTPDQEHAIAAILKTARGRARRPLVLSSDRGRGKSSALGLAAARLLADGPVKILLTAPRHAAVAPVFAQAARLLPQAQATPGALRLDRSGTQASLEYLPPDHLAQARPPADLLLVDEAAGIPAPLLETLLRHYGRIVFATTVHGYEGTGRGFEVRFRRTLDRLTPGWRALTLTTPIRWAEADPIETLAARALLLDASPAADSDLSEATPTNCTFVRLGRAALAADEPRLRELFGLLVLAHYQTRPADLRHLLDGPGLRIHALLHRGHIAAVALGALEGGFDPNLSAAVFAGQRRPHGHLLPQTLCAHAGLDTAPGLHYLRLVRIAVHPAIQGRALGRALVAGVRADALGLGLDLIGASFGATAGLLGFWSACGLPAAHIGTSRNAASGAQAAVVLAGLSPAGQDLAGLARRRLDERMAVLLTGPLRKLEPDIALALLTDTDPSDQAPSPGLDPLAWRELAAFAYAARPFEPVLAPLAALALIGLTRCSGSLAEDLTTAMVAAVLQRRDPSDVAGLLGFSGRAAVIATLRTATRALLLDLAPADLAGYVESLTRATVPKATRPATDPD